ncbi:MAG: 4Fe-4S cluster-binding domain-containing protein [Planctomycetota bacterium]
MNNRENFLKEHLSNCRLCPRECGIDRYSGKTGVCGIGRYAKVASFSLHFGEEPPLSGWGGSGTIFFSGCNLKCVFCQNYEISQLSKGDEATEEKLALMMLHLQSRGAHNINLVSPSHVAAQILAAMGIAKEMGLAIPTVYNSGGYDSVETLKMFEGKIDIYMPDAKYADAVKAGKYSSVKNYPEVNQAAIKEMHNQVSDLKLSNKGIAERGLIVRHLVMPLNIADSKKIIDFLADEVSQNTYFNLMDQYRPCYNAFNYKELNTGIDQNEFIQLYYYAKNKGLDLTH